MNIKDLFEDDSAVSPVIGVILMVAITVILAAVIGTFVLGLGSNVQSTPTAQFTFDHTTPDPGFTVTHDGGDSIEASALSVTYQNGGSSTTADWTSGGSSITAGESLTVTTDPDSGTDVRVIWEPSGGDTSQTLATSEAP